MTALEENRKANKNKKEKDDGLFSVSLCQVILSAVAVLSLLFTAKSGGAAAQNLKDDFNLLKNWSISSGDFQSTLKSIKDYIDSPAEISVFKLFSKDKEPAEASSKTDAADLPNESKTTDKDEKADKTDKEKKETTQESKAAEKETSEAETTAPKTTSAEKTTEKPSVKKTALSFAKNAGGKDLTNYKPEEKATSSKAETTAPIVRPVSGSYTSYFGYRTNPITGNNTFHTGVDIAAAEGTKIKAAYSGKVRKVGEDSRSGKYIYLTHTNGVETLYCHCSKILAEEGAVIRQGETVALVGSTGWSTGPHLHFEVHKDGTRLDPLPILKKG